MRKRLVLDEGSGSEKLVIDRASGLTKTAILAPNAKIPGISESRRSQLLRQIKKTPSFVTVNGTTYYVFRWAASPKINAAGEPHQLSSDKLPGGWLDRQCRRWLTGKFYARVTTQIVTDLREEHAECLGRGDRVAARWRVILAYVQVLAAIIVAMAAFVPTVYLAWRTVNKSE